MADRALAGDKITFGYKNLVRLVRSAKTFRTKLVLLPAHARSVRLCSQ